MHRLDIILSQSTLERTVNSELKMIKNLVIFFVVAAVLVEACPSIKSRASWSARNAKKVTRMNGQAKYVLIHHTASGQCENENACSAQVKTIQAGHMGGKRNYDDIGYNFLVDKFGNIYEGRGWGVSGAHAPGYNSRSVGISVIGNYQSNVVSESAKNAIKSLIACGVSGGKISSSYKLLGHRQTKATACPGEKLYQEIKTWPNWASSP